MKQTIRRTDKNLKILNELITSGFYDGYIGTEKFELIRNHFPNNHRLIGILDETENYELKFDFKPPVNIAAKISLIFGIVVSIISLFNSNWLVSVVFIIFALAYLISFKITGKKEIDLFTDKFIEIHKSHNK